MSERKRRLGVVIDSYFRLHDVDQKAAAKEMGISELTLTRIKQGKLPDADGFTRLLRWLMQETRP